MKRILGRLVVAVALLATSPATAQVFSPQTTTLPNGLQVVVLSNARAPVVTHMLWIKAGAMNDPWGHSGIAHFLEHLMFKGTKKYPEGMYSKIISRMGGQENAFTSYDYTAYYATVAKEHLPQVMALEADRLQNWQVTKAQVDAERQVILKERQQTIDNQPIARFWEQVNAALYPNHPYQRPVIGWKNEMETLGYDVATKFFNDYYTPSNAILVLSGDTTLDEVRPLLAKTFAKVPARPAAVKADWQVPTPSVKKIVRMTSPQVQETIWSRHYLVPPPRPTTIADSDALLVLSKIIGDGRTGRLYRRLVVKDKIANSASAAYDASSLGPAHWSLTVVPKQQIPLKKIRAVIQDEVHQLLQKGVTAQEVKDATQSLKIETVYARDSVSGPANIVGRALASALDLNTVERWPQRMDHVTVAAVNKAAHALFENENALTAILQPERKAQ